MVRSIGLAYTAATGQRRPAARRAPWPARDPCRTGRCRARGPRASARSARSPRGGRRTSRRSAVGGCSGSRSSWPASRSSPARRLGHVAAIGIQPAPHHTVGRRERPADLACRLARGCPRPCSTPEPPDALDGSRRALRWPDPRAAATRSPRSSPAGPASSTAGPGSAQLARDDVEAYACFRVGYHRGLDRLRQSGWRGSGYVRWDHETNRGFLRALDGLRRAAAAIGEADEEAPLRRVPPPARTRLGPAHRAARRDVAARRAMKRALVTGITGQDGRLLAEFLAGEGLPGVRPRPGPEQPEGRASCRRDAVARAGRRRPPRPVVADRRGRAGPARRGLQPRRDQLRARCRSSSPSSPSEITGLGVLRMLEAVRIVGGTEQQPDPLLPGVVVGDVRQGPRDAADRAHAVPPTLAVRRGQGVRPPHDRQLPRVVRPARVVGHPLQPRVGAARPRVRHPQDHQRRSRASSSGCRTRSRSATSTPRATGATRATTSRRCGSCSSRTSPTTTSSPPARPTRSASSSTSRSDARGLRRLDDVSCEQDPRFERPAEVDLLMGDATKAREKLGWSPEVTFEGLVKLHVRVRPRGRDRTRDGPVAVAPWPTRRRSSA